MILSRYERKFFVDALRPVDAIDHILLHPALFSEIYHERRVNNIYLDTSEFKHYSDNINGEPVRKKVRIRWYGDTYGRIENPTLEIKLKDGLVGYKQSYPLASFDLDEARLGDVASIVTACIDQSDLPEGTIPFLQGVSPTLLNHYERQYFESRDREYRMTVDSNVQFQNVSSPVPCSGSSRELRNGTIIELKYAVAADAIAHQVTNALPFRVTRSSKYVMGIQYLAGRGALSGVVE